MLVELQVENYAVVERLRVRFHPGLNVLTGETGSGKSIVVDSLGLLFGNRAASEAIRTGAELARVAGIFEVSSAAAKILESAGIEPEDGELLIEREIQRVVLRNAIHGTPGKIAPDLDEDPGPCAERGEKTQQDPVLVELRERSKSDVVERRKWHAEVPCHRILEHQPALRRFLGKHIRMVMRTDVEEVATQSLFHRRCVLWPMCEGAPCALQ